MPPQTAGTAQSPYSIANIFHFRKWKPLRGETQPRLNETQPLSLYFHADESLTHAIKALKRVRNPNSDAFRRKSDRVHRAQRLLLDTIHILYSELDDTHRAPRDYRRHLPPEDQRELEGGFSENILFAAQALSKGFRIRGIEQFTHELADPARELCAAMEAMRYVCRSGALNGWSGVGEEVRSQEGRLVDVVRDFDVCWTAFEQKICFCYFSVTYSGRPNRIDETDMFQVLMSETIIRAVRVNLITADQLQAFDPTVIVAIPRLTILSGLTHMPETVNMTDPELSFRWFRSKCRLLRSVQLELATMSAREVECLERMIADGEGAGATGEVEAVVAGIEKEEREKRAAEQQAVARTRRRRRNSSSVGGGVGHRRSSGVVRPGRASHQRLAVSEECCGDGLGGAMATFSGSASSLSMGDDEADDRVVPASGGGGCPVNPFVPNEPTAAGRVTQPTTEIDTHAEGRMARLSRLFVAICGVADEMSRAREYVNMMQVVFAMHGPGNASAPPCA
ncbi:hypothetical protein HK101_009116 [Irineochytrium annulatum]|nr:hypothetical protein HK101_009116 [Irineochytrium annulatum]